MFTLYTNTFMLKKVTFIRPVLEKYFIFAAY